MGADITCAKCGSIKVVPRAHVLDRGHYSSDVGNVRVGVTRKPTALLFKGHEKVEVYARVCGECGFAELFVEEPHSIYQAYLDSQSDPSGG